MSNSQDTRNIYILLLLRVKRRILVLLASCWEKQTSSTMCLRMYLGWTLHQPSSSEALVIISDYSIKCALRPRVAAFALDSTIAPRPGYMRISNICITSKLSIEHVPPHFPIFLCATVTTSIAAEPSISVRNSIRWVNTPPSAS